MDLYAIPVAEHLPEEQGSPAQSGRDKLILYRPLLQTAFVGNQAMADLVFDLPRS
jgi:hypothetical protein